MQLSGVYTALVTPFRDGAVDRETFRSLCRRQIEAGVAGLVPCGTTGETPTLSEEEWAEVVRTAVEEAEGRLPVIAGCGSNSTAHTVHTIERARELGADAALVVFPYYNKPNPAGMLAHVEAAARVGLPLILYHVPGRTGQRLPVGQLAELCNLPGVVGLKEATGDLALGQHLLELTDRAILSGDDYTFAPLVAMGGHGVVSVLSNIAPALTVAWDRAAREGDVQTLRMLRSKLMPVVRYLFEGHPNPVPVKAAMATLGLCTDEVRLPLAPCAGPDKGLLEGME